MDVENKNYLVVGGSSGIGLKIVEKLFKQDANVYVVSRTKSDALNDMISNHLELDVTQDDITQLKEFIPEELDGLVYCPGTITLKPFLRLKPEDFKRDMEINLLGAVKIVQIVLPSFKKNKSGSIVMFSTVATRVGMNFHSSIAAAKAAVEGFAKSLAAEYSSSNIRTNVIAPSLTDTPLANNILSNEAKRSAVADRHPIKRVGTVNDMANAAVFLLSPHSGWITGQTIGVDGGLSSLKSI